MIVVKRICILLIIGLLVDISCQLGKTVIVQSRFENVDGVHENDDILTLVEALEIKGIINQEAKNYILENIKRDDISYTIQWFEETYGMLLTNKTRNLILVEYFSFELMMGLEPPKEIQTNRYLQSYLERVADGEFLSPLGPPACSSNTILEKNKYGRLKVISKPDSCEVHIDGRFQNYSDYEFMLTIGEHLISVKQDEYKDFNESIIINSGRRHVIDCKLSKR
jgi:hypothetical protein